MIRARTRMYGSRTVVILAEPTHPALAAPPRVRSTRIPSACGSEALNEVLRDLSRSFAAQLLSTWPEPFRRITG